jgi:uncharacterized protein (DUF1800 family)
MPLATERDRIAHLLRRTGFGLNQAELESYAPLGLSAAVDKILSDASTPKDPALDVWLLTDPTNGRLAPPAVAGWWAWRMLSSATPLAEKMTLFWHDHFACSAEKVKAGRLMYQHTQLLRKYALADFGTLLREVARDPTMLLFLDGMDNVAGSPNENFARELMELYTMGIGNYSEKDVQEAARAFTGWSIERPGGLALVLDPQFLPTTQKVSNKHDDGVKTVLGRTANLDGDDVLDIVLQHPATARNVSRKLWEWFAYYSPSEQLVDELAAGFAASNFHTGSLLRTILTHPQFYAGSTDRALYKSPADFVIGTLRSIGFASAMQQRLDVELDELASMESEDAKLEGKKRLFRPLRFITESMAAMGQRLLYPPNVAGWDGGSAWVNSATMVERIKFAEIFSPVDRSSEPKAKRVKGQNRDGQRRGRVSAGLILGGKSFTNVAEAVQHIAQVFDAPLPTEKVRVIAEAVASKVGAVGTPAERQTLVYETARLIFATPEYQFM